MYLKALELHGFKSFAERTRLEFGPGISVVVGPNGSGKSNLADAVRWVLGEQSAKTLRGTKMEDIIFAGTKKRKPLGMAEVSLTLDNSNGHLPLDYTEITVTRRAYRSGESEYLINNSTCRLRDIYDLFVDSGIGRETFSIIGQGKVDDILNSRPEDRRYLIEETAGIVKYRNRKKEATRKLQDTEQNLQRVQDIIIELSGQLGPLEIQAAQARRFKEIKHDLDRMEINLAVHALDDLKVRLEEVTAKQVMDQQKLMELNTTYLSLSSAVEKIRLDISRGDEEISEKQRHLYQIINEWDRHEADVKLKETQRETLLREISRLEQEIGELEGRTQEIKTQQGEWRARHEKILQDITYHRSLIKGKEEAHQGRLEEIAHLETTIEELKSQVFDLVNLMAEKRNAVNGHNLRIQTLSVKQENLITQQADQQKGLVELAEKKRLYQVKLTDNQQRKEDLAKLNHALIQQLYQLRETVDKEEKAAADLRAEVQGKTTKLALLEEMQADYEGYFPGVRSILRAKRDQHAAAQGIIGVVAELITVPDEYRLAVETALGGAIQNLVTETDRAAKEAINFLKHTGGGRATFLPLDVINTLIAKDKDLVQPDNRIVGWANELISYPTKISRAIDYLLERILVVDNIDTAVEVARKHRYRLKIVTLDGNVINPGGAMTGGSREKKGSNLLTRTGEIRELKDSLTALHDTYQKALARIEALKADSLSIQQQQTETTSKFREAELAVIEAERDLKQLNEVFSTIENNLELLVLEQAQAAGEKDLLLSERLAASQELEAAEAKFRHLSEQTNLLQEKLKTIKDDLGDGQEELTDTRVNLGSLVQEESSVLANIERIRGELAGLTSGLKKRNDEIAVYKQDIKNKENEIADLHAALMSIGQSRGEIESELNQLKHLRAAEHHTLGLQEQELKTLGKAQAELQQVLHQLEIKQTRLEAEWENNIARLREKFSLTYQEALGYKQEIQSKRDVTIRVNQLKREIENMGEINLGAIEEFDRMSERYRFLSTQCHDLAEAKEALFKVIGEMDRIMVQRFQETFHRINHEFSHTFSRLFGGGIAELRLTDPTDLLETGIEIIAQPPGKKLQHLTLLSGGEKALTAIALLFGILRVKPCPFCVLDEIEANLDETNVDRFAAYMKSFAADSQFIVVSHRQGTMEVADVLYGVTMEENGISKLVSVKLAETEKAS